MGRIVAALVIVLLVGPNQLGAEEVKPPTASELESLIRRLGAESYHERIAAKASIVALGEVGPAVLACNILRESRENENPEIRMRCKEVVRDIYKMWVVGIGDMDIGADIGWFVEFDGDLLSTLPLVLNVREGGPAAQAGMKPGDAITHVGQDSCSALDGRLRFLHLLMKAPADQALSVRVKRFKGEPPLEVLDRKIKVSLSVIPEQRERSESDESEIEIGFQVWLKSLENRIRKP